MLWYGTCTMVLALTARHRAHVRESRSCSNDTAQRRPLLLVRGVVI